MSNTTNSKKIINKKMVKGLSNIVGSLLMIVLTIVAALLIGHFAFGLFSTNSHNAGVSISDASIIIPGGEFGSQGATVTVTLTDSGNDPVYLTTVQLIVNGKTYDLYNTSTQLIKPISGNYKTYNNETLVEPGQAVTLSGVISSSTFSSLLLQTGQTVVILASGVDNVTAQTVSQQVSIVVQD